MPYGYSFIYHVIKQIIKAPGALVCIYQYNSELFYNNRL